MNFFSASAVQPKAQVIRKTSVSTQKSSNPAAGPPQRTLNPAFPLPKRNTTLSRSHGPAAMRAERLARSSASMSRKRGKRKIAPSAIQRLSSSEEETEDSDGSNGRSRKRIKSSSASTEPDLKRKLINERSMSGADLPQLISVHGADLTSGGALSKYRPAFDNSMAAEDVRLQYPSAHPPERFQLVEANDQNEYKPLDDIIQSIEIMCQNYLPTAQAERLLDDSSGISRKLKRALKNQSEDDFKEVLNNFNEEVNVFRLNGTVSSVMSKQHSLSLPLIERILAQVYSRTVSPRVESLRRYENGTDNVYGELLPRFISGIFKDTKIKSDHTFVDLGSGVGNVVLQAALEIGCESWGCEIMENPCMLAELQQKEFEARCCLWGLAAGRVHLVRGDFLENDEIGEVLKRADVVLVNNQAFNPALNDSLMRLFLDLKEGCQIVSLKSFVPPGHKLAERNMDNPVNLLTVKKKAYYSNSVSWTDQGGDYFVATKDSSRLREFMGGRR